MKSIVLAVAIVLACSSSIHAVQKPISDDSLRTILRARVAAGTNPGIVVGILENGEARVLAEGVSGAPNGRLDGNTVFEIGSITKVFTGTLLADLAARGIVRLDEPVTALLPAGVRVPQRQRAITLVDLSTQFSGLPRLPSNLRPSNPRNPYADYTVEQLYAGLAAAELASEAGERFNYSNLGVGLLGHALALRAGMSYESLVRERLLAPLAMQDTRIELDEDTQNRLARGHDAAGAPASTWELPTLAGAGALRSTATDMLRFAAAHLDETHELHAVLSQARNGRRQLGPTPRDSIGLNWFVSRAGTRAITWHNGGTGGYRAFFGMDVPGKRAVIVLTNSVVSVDDIGRHVLDPTLPLDARRN